MQKKVVYKEIVDSEVAEAIRRCSVNLNGGEARRFVRRHARLTKAVSYDPHTYVEVELCVRWQDDDGALRKTKLWMPGFAQCMRSDQFDVTVGIVQAWTKAYENLVAMVECFRCAPSCCTEEQVCCTEEAEDLLVICERAEEPAVEFEEAVKVLEETENG